MIVFILSFNSGKIVGGYSGTPSSNVWKNEILAVPNGVKDVTITNNKYNDAELGKEKLVNILQFIFALSISALGKVSNPRLV